MAKSSGLSLGVLVRPEILRSPVALLFAASGPPTIARFIVPIHVDTVNRMVEARPGTHVCKEVLKGQPAVTDRDTSTRIVRSFAASVLHRLPTLIRGRDAGISRLRIFPSVTMLKRWLSADHVGTRFAKPRAFVAATGTVFSAFRHASIIQVVSPLGVFSG